MNTYTHYADLYLNAKENVTARIEMITPIMAQAWLQNQEVNRPIRKDGVNKIATDIIAGNWCVNGETIVILENGKLKDGQHRLTAIIQANCPIPSVVVRGVPNDARIHDVGARRTTVDIAKMNRLEGITAKKQVHAAVRALFAFREMINGYSVHNVGTILTDSELMRFLSENEQMLGNALEACYGSCSKNITARGGVIAATFAALSAGIQVDELQPFFNVVSKGVTDRSDMSPALCLAKTLHRICNGRGSAAVSFSTTSVTLIAIADFMNKANRTKPYQPSKTKCPYFSAVLPTLMRYQIVKGVES